MNNEQHGLFVCTAHGRSTLYNPNTWKAIRIDMEFGEVIITEMNVLSNPTKHTEYATDLALAWADFLTPSRDKVAHDAGGDL